MLISKIFEKTGEATAVENMANHLADKVRNIWQENNLLGIEKWESAFFEDPDGIAFLRYESFPSLIGIDYIFKWWGNEDPDGLSGELEVLWKVKTESGVNLYKTWIRFADRDFVLGSSKGEPQKRAANRKAFRDAFAEWQQLYAQNFK